jgi:PucR C-terminal helix-turn-helix domain
VSVDREPGKADPDLDVVARAIEGVAGPAGARTTEEGGGPRTESRLGPLVTPRGGRLVLVIPVGPPAKGATSSASSVEVTLEALVPGRWLAVAAPPVSGLAHVAEAYADTVGSVGVARRLGRRGLVDSGEVLLERALLVDDSLLARAVGRELGPILGAPRNATVLLATLDAFVEAAGNLRATARELGVAPRTIGYRIVRIESLIGERLAGPRLVRLTTAAFCYRLLGPSAVVPALPTESSAISPRSRRRTLSLPSARSRPPPPGRSRRRRSRGRAT